MSSDAIRGETQHEAADAGTGMGIPTGAVSDPMLRVGRLQDLGDTATDVIGVLRIYAAHGLVVVCVAEGLVLSPALSETARQWKVRRALGTVATARPAQPRRAPGTAPDLRRALCAERPSDRGRSGGMARLIRGVARLGARLLPADDADPAEAAA